MPATSTPLSMPNGIVFDSEDNLFFTWDGGLARVTAATGVVTNLIRGWTSGLVRDGSDDLILSGGPWEGVQGVIERMRVSAPAVSGGPVTQIAGSTASFDGPARLAVLSFPRALSLDAAGRLYIADRLNNRIRRFDPAAGLVTTVVGGGSTPPADGVAATAVSLYSPFCVFVDAQNNVFFDIPPTIWKMDARTGTIARVAGRMGPSSPSATGDGGPALDATFGQVYGILGDSAGNLFVSDYAHFRVRRIDAATGIITTVAGNGLDASAGDGGPGNAASIGHPGQLAFDRQGQLVIAGYGEHVRRLNLATGIITSLPGTPGGSNGVAVDRDNNVFLAYDGDPRIVRVRASDGLLQTIAGSTRGFFGDGGLASLARLSVRDGGLALDASGNLYVADGLNSRVRKLSLTVIRPLLSVSPGIVFFTQQQGSTLVAAQELTISSANGAALAWSLEVSTTTGGNWLTATSSSGSVSAGEQSTVFLAVDSSRLGAGTYRATVTIKSADASNSPQTVDVVLTVTGRAGAVLGISQQFLSFSAVQGSSNPPSQSISIANTGSGTLSWSATAETSNGGAWLKISPALGTAPSALSVSADITNLAQGVYQGRVIVRNLVGADSLNISVVLVVTKVQPILLPTQTGFLFVGVEGSLVIGPQSFAIQNAGQGSMDWQIQVNLPGGGDWLRVSPLSGTSVAGQPAPTVTLLVEPSKLRAGVSVALLTISGTGASNSPQTGIVLVNMLARGSLPVGTINPLGLIFTTVAGATGTLTQGLSIASTGGQALQFLARARTQAGGSWLTVTPEQGVLLSSAETANLTVQTNASGLTTGVYFGSVTLSFGTGVTQEVAVALVVASASTGPTGMSVVGAGLAPPVTAAACTARRLVIVETKLGNRFSLQVGWPAPMLAQVVDDCGAAVNTGTVTASFTSADPPVVFQNLRDGRYSATWVPAISGSVGVTVRAIATGLEDGVTQFAGAIGASTLLPLVFRDGWVNAASFERFKPLAPGMIFSLFGSNLAEGRNQASQIPLPRELGNLRVILGGIEAPLFYADGGQVNAQVPFDVQPGTASLVVTGRGSAGAPGPVTIVGAQPGTFTLSQSGTGQGVVLDAQNRLADASNPVRAGDVVVIYATGLGATNPPVGTGTASPASPPAQVTTPVTVTIGGQQATVEFAGLVPSFVGLYQVNARVPAGVALSSSVPLVITQNGVASNTVTIAVR